MVKVVQPPALSASALYFHGEGGQTLGRRGKSKDHRPELKQVVIGVVIGAISIAVASEINGNGFCGELVIGAVVQGELGPHR